MDLGAASRVNSRWSIVSSQRHPEAERTDAWSRWRSPTVVEESVYGSP